MAETMTWYPTDIISGDGKVHKKFGLVILNQNLELPKQIYSRIWENSIYNIAADGGANRVNDFMSPPFPLDTIIGDLDSIRPEVLELWKTRGTQIIHDKDQFSTDFTKAVRYLKTFKIPKDAEFTTPDIGFREGKIGNIKSGAGIRDIVVLGGLGGRVDQGMSTLHHLYCYQDERNLLPGKMFLLSSEAISFVLKPGRHRIQVRDGSSKFGLGKHIGIIPLKECSILTTEGLEWDVTDWPTEFGGQMSTSNLVKEDWVTIVTSKAVLFTIDLNVG
jgi:thiamine pyrophosphokinase